MMLVPPIVLLSAEMLNYVGSMGGQQGPNRGKIIEHMAIFSRKKHFFRKGIEHDLADSTFQRKQASL